MKKNNLFFFYLQHQKILSSGLKPPWNRSHLHLSGAACGLNATLHTKWPTESYRDPTHDFQLHACPVSAVPACRVHCFFNVTCTAHKKIEKVISDLIHNFLMVWRQKSTENKGVFLGAVSAKGCEEWLTSCLFHSVGNNNLSDSLLGFTQCLIWIYTRPRRNTLSRRCEQLW